MALINAVNLLTAFGDHRKPVVHSAVLSSGNQNATGGENLINITVNHREVWKLFFIRRN